MLRIDRTNQRFSLLQTPTLAAAAITERYDLQEFIVNSPEEFFSELDEELFVLGKEVKPSETVEDRIDVLCVDREGALVVVELKRGANKLQMLQVISYAGMLQDWDADDVLSLLTEGGRESLVDFLDDVDRLNHAQRVILVAEGYDYALLSGAQWLHSQYGVPITCCHVALASDGDAEYLSASVVYPPPELADQATARGRRARTLASRSSPTSWEEALKGSKNAEAAAFFKQRLAAGHECQLRYRNTIVQVNGRRRLHVNLKQSRATAVQEYRFVGDVEFWSSRLSEPNSLGTRRNGNRLRFFLVTAGDFAAFERAIDEDLSDVEWLARGTAGTETMDPDESEG